MSTFAPVREAYRLWERTAPQLTFDLEVFDAGTGPLAAPDDSPRGERPASTSPNNEGDRRNPLPGSAAVASQET